MVMQPSWIRGQLMAGLRSTFTSLEVMETKLPSCECKQRKEFHRSLPGQHL